MIKLLIAISILLSGCAAKQLSVEEKNKINNVGVINLVSEKAQLTKIGLTAFNNENSSIDMNGKVNSLIVPLVASKVAKSNPSWRIKEVNFDQSALITKLSNGGIVMAYGEERIQKELAEIASDNNLDAIYLVTGQSYSKPLPGGIGVWMSTINFSSIQSAIIYSNVDIKVIDKTGKVISTGIGKTEDPIAINPTALGLKYELKDNNSPELVTKLSNGILEHLKKAINKRSEQLGL